MRRPNVGSFVKAVPLGVSREINMNIRSILGMIVPAAAVGLSTMLMGSTPSRAEHLTMATKSPNEVRIRGYARFDMNCAAKEAPEVYLDVPPMSGFVCVRTSSVTVRKLYGGAAGCLGRTMSGIELMYLPRRTFTGIDTIRYTVKFPTATVTVEADINVQSDQETTKSGAIPARPENFKAPGPIPMCVPLVS